MRLRGGFQTEGKGEARARMEAAASLNSLETCAQNTAAERLCGASFGSCETDAMVLGFLFSLQAISFITFSINKSVKASAEAGKPAVFRWV